jgi:hypothetical protein
MSGKPSFPKERIKDLISLIEMLRDSECGLERTVLSSFMTSGTLAGCSAGDIDTLGIDMFVTGFKTSSSTFGLDLKF